MMENRLAGHTTGAGPPASGARTGDAAVIDAAVIDQLASITNSEGMSVLSELLNAFLGAVPARLDALDRAVATGALPTVAPPAPALPGSSASFGARGMATICRQLRAAADAADTRQAYELVGLLHAEYGRVRASLMSLIGGAT